MNGKCAPACQCNHKNSMSILWVGIIALILVNSLDDKCLAKIAAFLITLGDSLTLGITQGSCQLCREEESNQNCYY